MATAETITERREDEAVDVEAFIDQSRPESWSRQMVALFKAGHYREGYEILAEKMPFVESQLRPYAAYLAGEENHWSLSFEHLYSLLDRENASRILDVGCAAGSVAIELGRRGYETWGMDILPAMVERGQAFADSMGLRDMVHLIAGDVRHLADHFDDNQFDAVVSRDFFEHLDDASLRDVLRGLRRVVRPGGRLVVETSPSRCYYWFEPTRWKMLAMLIPMAWLPDRAFTAYVRWLDRWFIQGIRKEPASFYKHEHGHINCMDHVHLAELLNETGFENVETSALNVHLGYKDEGCQNTAWTRWLFGRKSVACRNVYGVATAPKEKLYPQHVEKS